MWERGYEAVGVAELCAEAGAPRGSFYYWWPSKQALVLAMIDAPGIGRNRRCSSRRLVGMPRSASSSTTTSNVSSTASSAHGRRPAACRAVDSATWPRSSRLAIRRCAGRSMRCSPTCSGSSPTPSRSPSRPVSSKAGVDPDDAAEALCAHMEGLMILAKARNDPTIIRRLSIDGRRLTSAQVAGAQVDRPTPATSR